MVWLLSLGTLPVRFPRAAALIAAVLPFPLPWGILLYVCFYHKLGVGARFLFMWACFTGLLKCPHGTVAGPCQRRCPAHRDRSPCPF